MKKLLNTLFVTTQGAYLCKEGETVCVRVGGEDRLKLPVHTIGGIVCFGQISCSPFLLGHCAENHVGVSFMTENGRFLARVQGPVSGNVLLRREQYRRADDPAAMTAMARSILTAKIANSRMVLLRAVRDHGEKADAESLERACEKLSRILVRMNGTMTLEELRGLEGEAARAYFGAFNECITAERDSFYFHERSRRPPLDNVNALLSFLYTLLAHDVSAALEGVGLDPAVGLLHRDRPGRPGLALDIGQGLPLTSWRSFDHSLRTGLPCRSSTDARSTPRGFARPRAASCRCRTRLGRKSSSPGRSASRRKSSIPSSRKSLRSACCPTCRRRCSRATCAAT